MWLVKKFFIRILSKFIGFMMRRIDLPEPELISGPGSLNQLPALVQSKGVRSVLLVSDKGISGIGLIDTLVEALDKVGIDCTVYDDVQSNPTIANIESGVEIYRANKCDGIIAFGGGSPMDCAKVINARIGNPKKTALQMQGGMKVSGPLSPLFAVPTTAGTGSECSLGAMVSDPESHEKFGVASPYLVPPCAVLDAELMIGLPPHITSSTGMDALTHAVESYIGSWASDYTNSHAEQAVEIILRDLEATYRDGADVDRRQNLAMASHHAGLAFTRAMVGYVHAISHNLGGLYGVPHGLANAVILPLVLDFCRQDCEAQLAKLAVIGGLGRRNEPIKTLSLRFIDKVREMNRNMDIPTGIAQLQASDIPNLAKRALAEAHPQYPVPRLMKHSECEAILQKLLTIRG
jgi:alcohol dehydrogenase class IV